MKVFHKAIVARMRAKGTFQFYNHGMVRYLAKPYTCEKVVLGSRFIAVALPLEHKEDLERLFEETKIQYPKATHYPYGARVGAFEARSDDGEPSRSSGYPILALLEQRQVDEIFLCVVRYFGGTKLGLPRLTRTYRETALQALEEAEWAEKVEETAVKISLPYAAYERLSRQWDKEEITFENVTYGISVTLMLVGNDKLITQALSSLPEAIVMERSVRVGKRRLRV